MKTTNAYVGALPDIYDKIPKAVLAAVAVSFAIRLDGEGNVKAVQQMIVDEWLALHEAGILDAQDPHKYLCGRAVKTSR